MNDLARWMAMGADEREAAVSDRIGDRINELIDSDEVSSVTATSNAYGWYVDEHHSQIVSLTAEECRASVSFSASGEHDEDAMFSGDTLNGTATAVIDSDGRVSFEDIKAEKGRDEIDGDGLEEDEFEN